MQVDASKSIKNKCFPIALPNISLLFVHTCSCVSSIFSFCSSSLFYLFTLSHWFLTILLWPQLGPPPPPRWLQKLLGGDWQVINWRHQRCYSWEDQFQCWPHGGLMHLYKAAIYRDCLLLYASYSKTYWYLFKTPSSVGLQFCEGTIAPSSNLAFLIFLLSCKWIGSIIECK